MLSVRYVGLITAVLVLATACSPSPPRPTSTPRAAAQTASRGGSPGPSPVPSPEGTPTRLGEVTYSDWGTRDARNRDTQDVDSGDFYFKGTFLQGTPGRKLKLRIRNVAQGLHNFSLPSQQVDKDIPPGGERVEVEVTVPDSGAVRFFCKFHGAQGMNGQLLAGTTAPQPLASAARQEPL